MSILNTARSIYAMNEDKSLLGSVGTAINAHTRAALHPTNMIGRMFGFGSFVHSFAERKLGSPRYLPGGMKNYAKAGVKGLGGAKASAASSKGASAVSGAGAAAGGVVVRQLGRIEENTGHTVGLLTKVIEGEQNAAKRDDIKQDFAEENLREQTRLFEGLGEKLDKLSVKPTGPTSGGAGGIGGILNNGAAMASGIAGGLAGAAGMALAPVAGIIALGTIVGGAIAYGLDALFNDEANQSELTKTITKNVMTPLGNMLSTLFAAIGERIQMAVNQWWDGNYLAHFTGTDTFSRHLPDEDARKAKYQKYLAIQKARGTKPMSESAFRKWEEERYRAAANKAAGRDPNAQLRDPDGNIMLLPEDRKKLEEKYYKEYGLFGVKGPVNPLAPDIEKYVRSETAKMTSLKASVKAGGGSLSWDIPESEMAELSKRTVSPVKPTYAAMMPSVLPTGTRTSPARGKIPEGVITNGSYVVKYLTEKHGISKDDAIAIAANMGHESAGFKTNAVGDGGAAIGLLQWNDRAPKLKKFAADRGKPWTDLNTQLDFAAWEITQGPERGNFEYVKNAKTIAEKTVMFSKYVERPSVPHYDSRKQWASKISTQIGAGGDIGQSIASPSYDYNGGTRFNVAGTTSSTQAAARQSAAVRQETDLTAATAAASPVLNAMQLLKRSQEANQTKTTTPAPGMPPAGSLDDSVDDIVAKILVAMGAVSQT